MDVCISYLVLVKVKLKLNENEVVLKLQVRILPKKGAPKKFMTREKPQGLAPAQLPGNNGQRIT